MPYRSRFRRLGERKEWLAGIQVTPTVVAVNALSTQFLLTPATLEEFTQPKVVKCLAGLFVSPATAPAAATGYGVFLGITRRVNVGGSAPNPDPELNPEHPWMWWTVLFPQIGGTAAADSNAARWVGYFPLWLNLRTRIRFRENEELILQVKNSNSSGASIQYSYAMRFLLTAGRK